MKKRFNNIDLLRFIFAVLIVMFHFHVNSLIKPSIMHSIPGVVHCEVCVDFFFIIAGFFLFYTINTTQSTFEFAKKRFLRLAPLIWIFLGISAILSIFINSITPLGTEDILRIFLLNDIGFAPLGRTCGYWAHWFVPVIFWISLFYFYIVKIIDKKYLNLIIWLIIIISLGLYLNYRNYNTGGNITQIFYFVNVGVLRGLFGMGIGYFILHIYKSGFLQNCGKWGKYIISVAEIYCVGFLTHYLLSTKSLPGKSSVLYFIIFSILFYLFLIKKGFLSKLCDNNFSAVLGSYSYSIYIMHPLLINIFLNYVVKPTNGYAMKHIGLFYGIGVTTAIFSGILIHYLFEKPIIRIFNSRKTKNITCK